MTGQNFMRVDGAQGVLVGSAHVPTPVVLALEPGQAHGGVQLDRVYFDLALQSTALVGGSMLMAVGKLVGGFAKNGCALIVLEGTTPVDVDFTALGSFTGLTSGAGDTSLALVQCLVFNNIGDQDLTVSPGATDGAQVPLECTVPAGGAVCVFNPAGTAVNAGASIITVTPTAGGVLALAYGGA